MQDQQHDLRIGDLGLSSEELDWIARVTPSVRRMLAARSRKAGGERALQAVHTELREYRNLLAAIPERNRRVCLHTLVVRAVLRAAGRDFVHCRSTLCADSRFSESVSTIEITARGVVDETAAVQHDLVASIGHKDLAVALSRLERREYEILSLKLWTGLSNADIAVRMQTTPEAVTRDLQRTIRHLRSFLKRSGNT